MWYKVLGVAVLIVILAIVIMKVAYWIIKLLTIVGVVLVLAAIIFPIYYLFSKIWKVKEKKK